MDIQGDAKAIWQKTCQDYLKDELSELAFQTWFEPIMPQLGPGKTFILNVPNELSRENVAKYSPLIENALSLATSQKFRVSVQVEVDNPAPPALDALFSKEDTSANRESGASKLNPAYTFSSFVVGPSNSFAHAACVAVASMHGQQSKSNYNPLFLYGGSGLGKTHLMQAIGNHVRQEFPEKKVMYVQSEQFVNEFIKVIATKKYDAFRRKYRMVDLLLIDDIQFIENKEQMQEEFFHTFNSLFEAGKNIVLTCDKPPSSLTTLEDRLRTRISSGLTIDITPPDYETRMAILDRLAQNHQVILSDDVMDYIASNIVSNIRELEGAFKTLIAFSMLGNELNLENTRIALKDMVQPEARQKLDAPLVMNVCANYFNVSIDDLKSKQRKRELVLPRHLAMYLCYSLVDMTYTEIGEVFGGRNHATVIHACNKIEEEKESDSKLKHALEEITLRLRP